MHLFLAFLPLLIKAATVAEPSPFSESCRELDYAALCTMIDAGEASVRDQVGCLEHVLQFEGKSFKDILALGSIAELILEDERVCKIFDREDLIPNALFLVRSPYAIRHLLSCPLLTYASLPSGDILKILPVYPWAAELLSRKIPFPAGLAELVGRRPHHFFLANVHPLVYVKWAWESESLGLDEKLVLVEVALRSTFNVGQRVDLAKFLIALSDRKHLIIQTARLHLPLSSTILQTVHSMVPLSDEHDVDAHLPLEMLMEIVEQLLELMLQPTSPDVDSHYRSMQQQHR